jgi:hypothetical protein
MKITPAWLVKRLSADLKTRGIGALADAQKRDQPGFSTRINCDYCYTSGHGESVRRWLDIHRQTTREQIGNWIQTHTDCHNRHLYENPGIFWRGMHDTIEEAGAVIIAPPGQGDDGCVSWIRLPEAWPQRDQVLAALRFVWAHDAGRARLSTLGVGVTRPLCRMGFRVMEREAFRFLMSMAGAGMAERDILAVYKSAQRQAEVQP